MSKPRAVGSMAILDQSNEDAATSYDAKDMKAAEIAEPLSEIQVLLNNRRSINPSTFPPPPRWPEKPLHVSRSRARMEADAASYIALPLIPQDKVPVGWFNNFPPYMRKNFAWNSFYGGMRWNLNERFHIPGRPKLLLYSDVEPDGTRRNLLEVEGQYILWIHNDDDKVWVPEGDPTLEEMLRHLSGGHILRGQYWSEDIGAELVLGDWHNRAVLFGETVYHGRIL